MATIAKHKIHFIGELLFTFNRLQDCYLALREKKTARPENSIDSICWCAPARWGGKISEFRQLVQSDSSNG
jgi:hypothetical protein